MNREREVLQNAPDPLSAMLRTGMSSFEGPEETFDGAGDLICFSHLRWDFVYQRPQHLMSRCARERRVFFIEEPVFTRDPIPRLNSRVDESGVRVVVPQFHEGMTQEEVSNVSKELIDGMHQTYDVRGAVLWYYTPMAGSFSKHLPARATVYDCMDELSLFRGAPPSLKEAEQELLTRADVVFTGGVSLYEAKKHCHGNIHPIPSSIDVAHFHRGRSVAVEPADQQLIPYPRLGFAGVIDERFDTELVNCVARDHPEWHFVMIGPVVKIDPASLPQAADIHYLGKRSYAELPAYFAGWDVALMPFARNDSTRYISQTIARNTLAAI